MGQIKKDTVHFQKRGREDIEREEHIDEKWRAKYEESRIVQRKCKL